MKEVDQSLWKNEIFSRGSEELKIFMMRNISREESWKEIGKKLNEKIAEQKKT